MAGGAKWQAVVAGGASSRSDGWVMAGVPETPAAAAPERHHVLDKLLIRLQAQLHSRLANGRLKGGVALQKAGMQAQS